MTFTKNPALAAQAFNFMGLNTSSPAMPTQQAAANKNNEKSPLLRLPFEIREMIFKLVVTQEEEIRPTRRNLDLALEIQNEGYTFMDDPTGDSKETVLSLTRTCRIINAESSSLYYSQNTFRFYKITDLHAFLSMIGLAHRRQLRSITFRWHNTPSIKDCFTLLKDCTALRNLTAYVWSPSLVWSRAMRQNRDLDTLKELKTFRQLRITQPEKFKLRFAQMERYADIYGEAEHDCLESMWKRGFWNNLGEDGGLYFPAEHVEEFTGRIQREITRVEACEEELARRRVPEQYLPGTRFSPRTQLKRVNYVEVDEDVDMECFEGEGESYNEDDTEIETCAKEGESMDVNMEDGSFDEDEEVHEEDCCCLGCCIGEDL